MDEPSVVTRLLRDWQVGDGDAKEQLIPLVYDELRRIAARYMRSERSDHTLQPTELVNEAYLRLIDIDIPWQDRAHFFAVAARAMRNILVDHARSVASEKRGGGAAKVTLEESLVSKTERSADIVMLDDALQILADTDKRKSDVIELRFFGGLTGEEIANVLNISTATVQRELRFAKAWLCREMDRTLEQD